MTDQTCAVTDCSKPVNASGYCKAHYYRWNRYGDPLGKAAPRAPKPPKVREACTVHGCELPQYAHGWCENHYARQRRHGGLHDARAQRSDPVARFWSQVNKTDTCWLWTGGLNNGGYGRYSTGDGSIGPHVYAVLLDGREVPDGMEVDHLCRVRHCVRPDHLDVVTHTTNVRRSLPHRAQLPTCRNGHELTLDNVMPSQGKRACRICVKAAQRRYRQKLKTM
jgi:hypothetical protein